MILIYKKNEPIMVSSETLEYESNTNLQAYDIDDLLVYELSVIEVEEISKGYVFTVDFNVDGLVESFNTFPPSNYEIIENTIRPTEIELLQQKVLQQDQVMEEIMFVIIPEMMGGGM